MLRGHKRAGALLLLAAPLAVLGLERPDLLPESLAPHIRVGNCAALRDSLNRVALDELRSDKQFQDFSAAMAEKIKSGQSSGKMSIELSLLYDLIPQLRGETVFALAADTPDPKGKGFYLLAAASEADYAEIKQRCEWLRIRTDAAIKATTDTFQNHELIRFDNQINPDESPTYWQAHSGNTLLLSNNREWVERSLVRLSRDAVVEPQAAGLRGYLPLGKWIRHALNEESDLDAKASRERWYRALGLLGLGDCTIDITGSGAMLTFDINLEIDDLNRGVFMLLDTTPAEPSRRGLIPVHASSFSIGRINLSRFWKQLPTILSEADSALALQFQSMCRSFTQTTGADLGRDLIDHLGTTFCTYSVLQGTNQHFVVALELNDGRAFGNALDGIFAYAGMQPLRPLISVSDFRGKALYSLFQNPDNSNALSFCATENLLLFGPAASVRESILGLENDSAREPSRLEQEAGRYTDADAFIRGATDHKETDALVTIRLSDHDFKIFAGIQSNAQADGSGTPLGENEISLNYIGSFLHDSYYSTEKTDRGLHHRIVLVNQSTKE